MQGKKQRLEHQENSDKLHTAVLEALSIPSSVPVSVEGMLNANETAVCNLSEFCWCSKRCLFSCYLQRQVLTYFRIKLVWSHFQKNYRYTFPLI